MKECTCTSWNWKIVTSCYLCGGTEPTVDDTIGTLDLPTEVLNAVQDYSKDLSSRVSLLKILDKTYRAVKVKSYTKEERIRAALQIFGLVDESSRGHLEWVVGRLIDEYKQ